MTRRLACAVVFLALAAAPTAAADGAGPDPGLMQGWTGVTTAGHPWRYVTLPAGAQTVLAAVRRSTGRIPGWRPLRGTWGVPMVAYDGSVGGLSRDGRLLVLAQWSPPGNGALRTTSRFLLLNTRTLRTWRTVTLRGDFTFDALSPGGGTLFLIERVSRADTTKYRVRSYDIASQRLSPRVIADRRQAGWVMRGYPVTRATSADGRWVYTLYQQPGGYPFVHALDAVGRSAVCIGLPWHGVQDILPSSRLRLNEQAGKLWVQTYRGRALFSIDTRSFWVARAGAGASGTPAALLVAPPLGAAALLALVLAFRRRLRAAVSLVRR
ncbi:MAG TPA: hypothetical protein VJT84_07065 [Gaiellaceae bacterium]|nr:hypothetical protein [Gaiellaceae bacterium]